MGTSDPFYCTFIVTVRNESQECWLPDFSRHNLPKRGKNIPTGHNITKWPWNIPNGCKTLQMTIKYTNIFPFKAIQNLPKLIFMVWKYTIWQPWSQECWCTRAAQCLFISRNGYDFKYIGRQQNKTILFFNRLLTGTSVTRCICKKIYAKKYPIHILPKITT
jgi:hypothetical protein